MEDLARCGVGGRVSPIYWIEANVMPTELWTMTPSVDARCRGSYGGFANSASGRAAHFLADGPEEAQPVLADLMQVVVVAALDDPNL